MRPASTYEVQVDGADAPAMVEVRPVHWLRLERDGHADAGTYEQLLRVIHQAGPWDDDFDDWMPTVVSWSKAVQEVDDDGPPSDQQPGTSPG